MDIYTEIEEVAPKVKELQPDLLVRRNRHSMEYTVYVLTRSPQTKQFCASMWTAEQAAEIQSIAKQIKPDIKTHAIPYGLQVEKGPDAIVEYLLEKVPPLLDS